MYAMCMFEHAIRVHIRAYLDVREEGEHDGDRHARKERIERDHREGGERGAGERGERVVEGPRGAIVGHARDGQAEGRAEKAAEGGRRCEKAIEGERQRGKLRGGEGR